MPKWLVYSLATIAAWGAWGALGKALGHLSAAQSQALSTLGIAPLVALLAVSPKSRQGERKRRGAIYALAAGLIVGAGNLAYYHALALGAKAATAASLTALYPIATVLLAVLLLKEKPRAIQVAGIALSLAAMLLLNAGRPEGALSGWMLYALAPIALWGAAALLMKVSTQHVSAELSALWFLGAFVPLALALAAIEPIDWRLPARDWCLLALLGATYGAGNLTVLAAYRAGGKASIVTPLTALYPLMTIPVALVLFGEALDASEWAGVVLALLAAVALSYEPERAAAPES